MMDRNIEKQAEDIWSVIEPNFRKAIIASYCAGVEKMRDAAQHTDHEGWARETAARLLVDAPGILQ